MKSSDFDEIILTAENPFPADLSEYRGLFESVFGSPEYFDFFTELSRNDGYLISAREKSGALAGMLFLYPCMLKNKDSCALGYYMYSVCVAENARGHGIFRRMCAYADSVAQEHTRGESFIALIPADTALFETYKRMGYDIPILGKIPVGTDYEIYPKEKADALFAADLLRSESEPTFIMIKSAQPFTRKAEHTADMPSFEKGLLKRIGESAESDFLFTLLPDADNFPE